MYTKEQASTIKQSFWKAFGQYMSLHHSADGQKINWINYKTGIKYLAFKMQADHKSACIMIEMSQPDIGMQELVFAQFEEVRKIFDRFSKEQWQWELHVHNEHRHTVSRISKCIDTVNIFKQEDWPELISFFKPRIMALDEFWSNAQYGFEIFR